MSLATTVFWLLCLISAIAGETVALLTKVISQFVESRPLEMIHGVAIFLSLITAIVAVLSIPVVLRVRATRPPQSAITLTYVVAIVAVALAVLM